MAAAVAWSAALLTLVLAGLPPAWAEPVDVPTSLTITSGPPPTGHAGLPYSHTFTADGVVDRWEVADGTLVSGLSLDPTTGELSGTPTVAGTTEVAVAARQARNISSVDASFFHTCALTDTGAVMCWGANGQGQLGYGNAAPRGDQLGEMGDALPTVDLGTGRTATAISAGSGHTCAILDTGAVKCWGNGWAGALGYGDTANRGDQPGEMGDALPTVDLGTGRTATAISAGGGHTCTILDNGNVKCWGFNAQGQLGLGSTAHRGDQPGELGDGLPPVNLGIGRTATAIATGASHTCVILDNGNVKCWGDGLQGQLGNGSPTRLGDAPGEMGLDLPPVALGTGRVATAVALGDRHTCALLDDATLKCWGEGSLGRLGTGDVDHLGDQPGEMGDNLPPVALGAGRSAVGVAAGGHHTCAVLDDATLKCWGWNSSGQLGQGDTANRGGQPGDMGDALLPVDLGSGRAASTVTAGNRHTCVRREDDRVACWGYAQTGVLGSGSASSRGDQPGEMGDALPAVELGTTPAASQAFTLAVEGVSSMSPKAGLTSGGTQVTLTGLGFSDVTGVRFGPTPATSFTVVDDITITAVAPARPAGLVNVWLDSASGSNANLAVTNFSYQSAPTTAPTITSVSPNIGDVAGGQTVTITGTGFLSASNLKFGQTPAAGYTIVNDSKIVATTPSRSTPALVNVWVTNPHGTNPNQPSSWYDYRTITGPPPTVTAVSPGTGPTTGGQTITLTGTGFTGTLRIDVGTTTAPAFTVVSDTTITVTTPARPAGLVNVWVRTNNGANPNQQTSWYRYQ